MRRRRGVALLVLCAVLALVVWRVAACGAADGGEGRRAVRPVPPPPAPAVAGDGVKVGTFLGNYGRRYYGQGPAPRRLDVLWKVKLGSGWSSGKYEDDPPSRWAGSGWTGQPSVVVDQGRTYVVAPSYGYKLRKIDAATGEVLWSYRFDDIIKGSPTVFRNPSPTGPDDAYIVVAGSRRGYPHKLDDPRIAPVRALTFGSGKELWRLPVPRTACYSRDCDGSGFFFDGVYYVGVESGWVYALDPFLTQTWAEGERPSVRAQRLLLGDARAKSHDGNLVLESSVSAVGETLYVASGAGHVYGLRRPDLEVVWDYYIGADLDGTPVPTDDGLLLQAVEKEYIKGKGGMLALDPAKPPDEAVVWYFPTGDRELGDWAGGVVGSASVNDAYDPEGRYPALCAFNAIDGHLYVVARDVMSDATVAGPNREKGLATPVQVAKIWNGGAISTPILLGDALVAAGYDQRVHLYDVRYTPAQQGEEGALPSASGDGKYWTVAIEERDQFFAGGAFESTPTLWDGRIYIGCRDGWFYCLGEAP
ncbi:MAG: PQQ-binding-like beta-propeller repeat protein [Acidobacteriota bacterium]|nr:PQQ-binding-like beta-propeller repeat protein [Acidobacteriota bacterium]